MDAANKIFKLPQCNKVFPRDFGKSRPCLNYYISQCCGLCTGKIKKSDYDEAVDGAIAFLKGDSRDIIADLRVKMEKAAEELDRTINNPQPNEPQNQPGEGLNGNGET